jgi:hypothetical protein
LTSLAKAGVYVCEKIRSVLTNANICREAGGIEPEVKRKPRVKDVFGRSVATEEEFAVLKDAPK